MPKVLKRRAPSLIAEERLLPGYGSWARVAKRWQTNKLGAILLNRPTYVCARNDSANAARLCFPARSLRTSPAAAGRLITPQPIRSSRRFCTWKGKALTKMFRSGLYGVSRHTHPLFLSGHQLDLLQLLSLYPKVGGHLNHLAGVHE